jgi:NADPH:quinone reductase-like Zn-dependent oxidoreductase
MFEHLPSQPSPCVWLNLAAFVDPSAANLTEIEKLVNSVILRPVVETLLPLAEARRAQELNQSGHTRGEIVLRVV